MPETSKSLFYNSQNGDRLYDADSFEHWLKRFFTSGVFTGCCQVTASGSGMTCTMSAGYANVDGKVRFFDESVTLTLQNAHSTYDRIDTIVVERNDMDREITAKVVTGSYSATAVATAPVRSGGIYQLVLAEVYVAAGSVSVGQENITDKRPDTSVCGYVVSAVSTPDFSELYAQFSSQFAEWFEHMKDQLDEDAAGHLQNEIDALNDAKPVLVTAQTLTNSEQEQARTNIGAVSSEDIDFLRQNVLKYAECSFMEGVEIDANGNSNVTITRSMMGISHFVRVVAVVLIYAWPLANWGNGAVVAINNVITEGQNIIVGLTTTSPQTYKLRFMVLYV